MQPKVLKYILDIESAIQEIEWIKEKCSFDYDQFASDIIFQRAVERDLEIIGEAIRKMIELDSLIYISSAKNIIGLRNIIAHAYDSVDPQLLWGIIMKNIPILGQELKELKSN